MIELKDVHIAFDHKPVLNGVSFSLDKGESLVIMGESGVGKSTILRLILGLIKPDSGQIYVANEEVTSLRENEMFAVRQQMGIVFQGSALFDSLTVGENVGYRLIEQKSLSDRDIEKTVREKLSFVGLEAAIDMMPAELSGGMKKRVAIARALAGDPEIMLYDEPTTALDPITSNLIDELIRTLHHSGVTSITVTHILKDAFKFGEQFIMLHEGDIIFNDRLEQFKNSSHPYIKKFLT